MSTPQIGPAPEQSDGRMTSADFLDTLTGFDELAIAKAFGKPLEELTGPSMGGRALVFVLKRRDGGMKDAEAHKYAMGLAMKAIDEHFLPNPDDELPGSEAGKGDG